MAGINLLGETRAEPEVSPGMQSDPTQTEEGESTQEEHAQSRELGWGNNP